MFRAETSSRTNTRDAKLQLRCHYYCIQYREIGMDVDFDIQENLRQLADNDDHQHRHVAEPVQQGQVRGPESSESAGEVRYATIGKSRNRDHSSCSGCRAICSSRMGRVLGIYIAAWQPLPHRPYVQTIGGPPFSRDKQSVLEPQERMTQEEHVSNLLSADTNRSPR